MNRPGAAPVGSVNTGQIPDTGAQGSRYGRYEIVRRLAAGGMGEVFLARSVGIAGFQKYVVIKRILPHLVEQPQFVEGLVREAKLMVMLDHPNIVQVLDLGVESDDYFMTMEFVNGYNMATIAHYCAQKRLLIPSDAVASITLGVLNGLDYAHSLTDPAGNRQNIIHRDISPQNVMISREARVKITDFGIAKVLNQADSEVTQTLKGKFRYMAPEAVNGGRIDRRYDIFAAGILLFEGLCRRHLFGGRSDIDILNQVKATRIPPIERYYPDISSAIVQVVKKALAQDPEKRYQHASEFAKELRLAILPTSEAEANEALQAFVSELYNRDDFPINKPKLPDLDAVELDMTRSIVLQSHVAEKNAAAEEQDPNIRRKTDVLEQPLPPPPQPHQAPAGGKKAIIALSTGLVLISALVLVIAYALFFKDTKKPAIIPSKVKIDIHDNKDAGVAAKDAQIEIDQAIAKIDQSRPSKIVKRPPIAPKPRCRNPQPFTSAMGVKAFGKHQGAIRRCISNYLKDDESLKVNIISSISRYGKVKKVTISPAPSNAKLKSCLARAAKRIRYPCHTLNSVTFRQPIVVAR